MGKLKKYNAGEVGVIFGSRALQGFTEGTFVTVTRLEDSYTMVVGADGEPTRSKTNNRSGSIEITLKQSSDSNDFLSEMLISDESSGIGIAPLQVVDNSGRTIASAIEAWVMKPADSGFGRDAEDRTWTIQCGDLDLFVGGN